MRFALAIVIACTGCKGLLGLEEGVLATSDAARDASDIDAPDDGAVDATSDGFMACYGVAPFEVCPTAANGVMPVTGAIDTSNALTCDFVDTSGGRNWCVVIRENITISTGVSVVGARPLVLLARNDLTISLAGMVDAASHEGGTRGPAANHSSCASGNGTSNGTMGSGGAGGSFGSVGGAGGRGTFQGIPGGVAQSVMVGDVLRGGCKGGKGAPGAVNVGGDGGGAVYLVAGTQIRIDGLVNASGAGGSGGEMPGTGAGGGGSGGMIVLSAPTVMVTISAQIFANGGGGGAGGGNTNNGGPGRDPTNPLQGGEGDDTPTGGAGGRGASAAADAGSGQNDQAGGGGGGGGVGRIRVLSPQPTLNGLLSPAPN